MDCNMEMIKQTGALKCLSKSDQEMLKKNRAKLGSTLCSVLRHHPERIGVSMDLQAWVNAGELIRKFNEFYHDRKFYLSLPVLMEVVHTDDKQRYGLKGTGPNLMIRCRQGHSIPWLEMDYRQEIPPEILYHGTIRTYLDSILEQGILPMERQKVHLSRDIPTAQTVAKRRKSKGQPIILQVNTARMAADGVVFYLAENGVWLTDYVDPKYVSLGAYTADGTIHEFFSVSLDMDFGKKG